MNCKHCGNTLANDTKLCHTCGKPVEGEKLERDTPDIEYFSIPLRRLAFLSVLTLGLYEIFWFYKNWEAIRKTEQQKISPFGRAIFAIFYCYSFFKKVLRSAKKYNYSDSYSPELLATLYIVLFFVGNGLGQIEHATFEFDIFFLLIALSSFVPLLSVQKAINFNNSKIVQNYNERRKFSRGEIVLIVLGIILFGLVLLEIFSSFIPNNG